MAKSALSIILFILNIIYLILGVVLIYASVSYYLELQFIKQIRTSDLYVLSSGLKWAEIVPYILFSVGALVALVTFCGFGGAYSRTVLIVYVVFLTAIVAVSTAAASVVYSYADNNSTDEFIARIIENGVEEVTVAEIEAGNTTAFGKLEERYRCCGDKDAKYYLGLTREGLYPKSCCGRDQPCSGKQGNAKIAQTRYGCRKVVANKTRNRIYYLWIACACLSVVGLLNLIVSGVMIGVKVKKQKKRRSFRDVQDTQTLRINGASNSVAV